jgi:hypothetical protein
MPDDARMPRRAVFWLDIAVKAALVGLLIFALARPDLPQFHGKAILGRALTYPISAILVPGIWYWRFRHTRYPYALDILIVLPFLIDTAGNAADLYDSIGWWDDLNHLVNWAILTAGFGQLLVRLPLGRLNVAALAIGFGTVTNVLWEFGEYLTFIRNNPNELRGAYTDTLLDMALSLTGTTLAAAVTATLLWHGRRELATP